MKARSLQMTDFINPTDATERVFNIATFRKSINQFNRHFVDISWTFHGHFPGVVHRLRKQYLCIKAKNGNGDDG